MRRALRTVAAVALWIPVAIVDRLRGLDPPARLKWALDWARETDRPLIRTAFQPAVVWRYAGRPPMDAPVLRGVILGTLEDFGVDELLTAERLNGPGGLVDSLTESWLKDRGRAVQQAKSDSRSHPGSER